MPITPTLRGCVTGLVVAVACAAPAAAGPHRARLSADLADHLAAGSQAVDVIVHGDKAAVEAIARRYNVAVKKYLKEAAVFRVTAGQLSAIADDDSQDHLSADIEIRSSNLVAETIGADQVWAGSRSVRGFSGAGVGVALIDSGVDLRHEALRRTVIYSKDFTGGNGIDQFGHGTHIAAIIAGQTGRNADTSDYRGIAPGASIINLRVLDAHGAGKASDVIAAIEWAIDNRKAFGIRVINLSLGAPVLQPYRDDPLCEAVERAVSAGLVVVASAGNYGYTRDGKRAYGTITSPGNDPSVITVGALDVHNTAQRSDDTIARYSSRGPTMFDLVVKPDLVAPGSHVVSAEAAGSYLAKTYPERHVAGGGAGGYMQLSGTSMAAGVVSGAVALLLEQRPKLSPQDAKMVLQLTSSFLPAEGLLASGSGSINTVGAAEFLRSPRLALRPITFGTERIRPSGVAFLTRREVGSVSRFITSGSVRFASRAFAWGNTVVLSGTRVWEHRSSETFGSGDIGDTIIWGSGGTPDTIVWGSGGTPDTIIWGSGGTPDTIVWGSGGTPDTIVWGSGGTPDTIVWGSGGTPDTIVWGSRTDSDPDTILWRRTTTNAIPF